MKKGNGTFYLSIIFLSITFILAMVMKHYIMCSITFGVMGGIAMGENLLRRTIQRLRDIETELYNKL